MTVESKTFAVLIGVEHYAKLPRGAGLRGPAQDVLAWHNFLTEAFQVPDEQIVRLESPAGGVGSGRAATTANAEQAADQMAEWLQNNSDGTGVFVFSGHGATSADSTGTEGALLRLCMEDFDPDEDPNGTSVGLGALNRRLQSAGVADRVTIVTDCCYTNFEIPKPGLGGTEPGVQAFHARMLLGSGEFSPAYSMEIDGTWRGVFTYALLSAMNLWKVQDVGGVRYIMGSHQDLLYRTRSILSAMGFEDQQPVYGGGPFVAALPFNYPKALAPRAAVSLMPNSPRTKREVTSGTDHPGIMTMGLPGAGVAGYVVSWGLCGTQTTGQVTTGSPGGPGPVLGAGQFAMYQATTVDLSGAQQLDHYYDDAGTSGQLNVNYVGTWSEALPEQDTNVTWTPTTPQFGQDNPAFGPVQVGIGIAVYIQFYVQGGQITQVQYWTTELQGAAPTTAGLQMNALSGTLDKVTDNPDPGATWFCTTIDAFSPFTG